MYDGPTTKGVVSTSIHSRSHVTSDWSQQGRTRISKESWIMETDKNGFQTTGERLPSERSKYRGNVSVSDSGQLVSILSLIGSERLDDTQVLADTNPSGVTPTGWERPRTRPCWRTVWVRMCYMSVWHESQWQKLRGRCWFGRCWDCCICLFTSIRCAIFLRSEAVQVVPLSHTQVMSSLWQSSRLIFGNAGKKGNIQTRPSPCMQEPWPHQMLLSASAATGHDSHQIQSQCSGHF